MKYNKGFLKRLYGILKYYNNSFRKVYVPEWAKKNPQTFLFYCIINVLCGIPQLHAQCPDNKPISYQTRLIMSRALHMRVLCPPSCVGSGTILLSQRPQEKVTWCDDWKDARQRRYCRDSVFVLIGDTNYECYHQ